MPTFSTETPEDEIFLLGEGKRPSEAKNRCRWTRVHCAYVSILHVAVILLFATVVIQDNRVGRFTKSCPSLYSPVNEIIKYEDVLFYDNIFQHSPYQGTPDDAKDEIWKALHQNTRNTVISADAASQLPNKTVLLAESDGAEAIVSFEVFHQLHCLDALRQTLYPDRYPGNSVTFPNGTVNPERLRHHEHCIDRIRQGLQCASDVGTIYWNWHSELDEWQLSFATTHSCRNFEEIRQWVVKREYTNWNTKAPPL